MKKFNLKEIFTPQVLYMLATALLLLILVLLFSFFVLIPQGKEYRIARMQMKQTLADMRQYEQWHEDVSKKLKDAQVKNRDIITAFSATFNPERFVQKKQKYFETLKLHELALKKKDKNFAVYEVNATSTIYSPKQFYDFVESLNKDDWIIAINFPITFKREQKSVRTTFTMNVYAKNRALATTEKSENVKSKTK